MRNPASIDPSVADAVLNFGPRALPPEEKTALIVASLQQSPEAGHALLAGLVASCHHAHAGLREAQGHLNKTSDLLDKLTRPPLHPATFLRFVSARGRQQAEVLVNNARRLVETHPEVDLTGLGRGDEVYLSHELNIILLRPPRGLPRCGELGQFLRLHRGEQIVVKWRDEEMILEAADSLPLAEVKPGDTVRFSREALIAFERIEAGASRQYLLEELPDLPRSAIGGQDENLRALLSALCAALVNPDLAAVYLVTGRNTILLSGPPGCGKTLLARIAASEVARHNKCKCHFAVIKPGELESPWVGETQRNIRELFKAVNKAAESGFCVVFLDEVETIGRIRGTGIGHHDDKAIGAFLAEINGFKDRANVAIIAATNRPDLIDPALHDRLADVRLVVRRPNQDGARCIFGIHLPATLPFNPNSELAAETHEEIIETAVSQLYAPNADNEICRVHFRDGKDRMIAARELVSGRLIEQICKAARTAAFLRELEHGGPRGITVQDMQDAVSAALERLRGTLTPANARSYLDDLPQDVDVVAVDPVVRRVKAPHRYIQPAAAAPE
jgi:proteasome-associated ATPase